MGPADSLSRLLRRWIRPVEIRGDHPVNSGISRAGLRKFGTFATPDPGEFLN
jgi:hypothetical protein